MAERTGRFVMTVAFWALATGLVVVGGVGFLLYEFFRFGKGPTPDKVFQGVWDQVRALYGAPWRSRWLRDGSHVCRR